MSAGRAESGANSGTVRRHADYLTELELVTLFEAVCGALAEPVPQPTETAATMSAQAVMARQRDRRVVMSP